MDGLRLVHVDVQVDDLLWRGEGRHVCERQREREREREREGERERGGGRERERERDWGLGRRALLTSM